MLFTREPLKKTALTLCVYLLRGMLLLFLLLSIRAAEPALARSDSLQKVKITGSDTPETAKAELILNKLNQEREPWLTSAMLPGIPTDKAVLVKATNMFQFSPPSPDSSGIAYLPQLNALLISDGEVNEMPIFTGDNLFLTSLAGSLLNMLTTISFSDEPTDVAYNPRNEHLFFSDDTGNQRIFEMNPGPDGNYDTSDDIITRFSTPDFGSMDPEGLTFDSWRRNLFLVDGFNAEVYKIEAGPNSIFDGVAPAGDDLVSHFDVANIGINDPEGIEFNPDNGHLYILPSSGGFIAEIKRNGTLIRYIDFASLNIDKPAGLAYAPASGGSAINHLYIVARGVDNGTDPNENDGMLYEISFSPELFFPLIRR